MKNAIYMSILALAACDQADSNAVTSYEATEIANRHFHEVLPQVPLNMMTVESEEAGSRWRISYRSPENSTGGRPLVVEVDRQTGNIIQGLR
jgi:hypothetical protein